MEKGIINCDSYADFFILLFFTVIKKACLWYVGDS